MQNTRKWCFSIFQRIYSLWKHSFKLGVASTEFVLTSLLILDEETVLILHDHDHIYNFCVLLLTNKVAVTATAHLKAWADDIVLQLQITIVNLIQIKLFQILK